MASDIEERIRARAHAIWEEEGRPEGRAEEHWARATREVEAGMAADAAEKTDAPAVRKPTTRKPAGKTAEPAAQAEATPAKKPAARRKTTAADKTPTVEAVPEPAPRKPRARKAQSA